ncbi:MAG: ABC transporter permease [Bacteriovoracaceae bacterium]
MFFLSWRQLITRKKQTFLILLGISFGTLLYVFISGVQLGMRRYISEQLLNNTAHVLIKGSEKNVDPIEVDQAFYKDQIVRWLRPPAGLREESKLENYSGWYQFLSRDSRVLDFAPRLSSHVILSVGKFTSAVSLIGTIPDKQIRISSVERYMKEGRFSSLIGGNKIVIGSEVAKDLGVQVGQYIHVTAGKGTRSFKVVGVFHFGNKQVDRSMAFAALSDVQILTKKSGEVNEIAVALYNIDEAEKVASEWKILTKDQVEDWKMANQQFMEMIKVQDFTRYFITIAVLLVASFGIYNVLTIMINQKRREIAILRAIGYGPDKILRLILYQGLVLGVAGGVLGLVLGFFVCLYIGSINLNLEIGGSHHLLISYDPEIYITAFIAAILSSLCASIIPARAASLLTPMEIIRSE